jgi:hypothetical protein
MKNVTITLPDELARRARVAAAKEDKSLSRFVADLLEKQCESGDDKSKKVALLCKFLDGPGFPGASKAWPGREVLYGEREDELLRRYESADLRAGPSRSRKAEPSSGFAEADRQRAYAGPESTESKRVLPRHRRKTPHGKRR